jgi:hypothetical protein
VDTILEPKNPWGDISAEKKKSEKLLLERDFFPHSSKEWKNKRRLRRKRNEKNRKKSRRKETKK